MAVPSRLNCRAYPMPSLTDESRSWKQQYVQLLAEKQRRRDPLAELRRDPTTVFVRAGIVPDAWQRDFIGSFNDPCRQLMLLCCRRTGKSTASAAMAVLTMLLRAPATVLVISATK